MQQDDDAWVDIENEWEEILDSASAEMRGPLLTARAAPLAALDAFIAVGYTPCGDGAPLTARAGMLRQSALFAILGLDDATRAIALRLTSGYIQALIAGVVEAPRQDVDALSRSNGCCGTIKPHGLDAIRALDEALGYLEDGAQDGSDDKADCDATLEYIGSRAGAIVDRLYSDRSLLRNVVRSNHHGKEYTRPFSGLICTLDKIGRVDPSLVESCPRVLTVLMRMLIDLDDSHPELAEAGCGLHALFMLLGINGRMRAEALGRPGLDLWTPIDEPDAMVLAFARHISNPVMALEAMMSLDVSLRFGGQAEIDCFAAPDLGLAVAVSRAFDTLMAMNAPSRAPCDGYVTLLGAATAVLNKCLAGQPYALGKVLANGLLLKLATAQVGQPTTLPVTAAGLIDTIKTELDSAPTLRRKHRRKIDEAVSIALAGLPNQGATVAVRKAWMALGGRASEPTVPTPSIDDLD